MNNIKMHGAWIQVNYWLNVEKKEPSPSSAVVWCPPPPMCPRYLLTKPPKVMMFSYQYVKIYISTVMQLYVWHCQLFIHDTHFKFFFFFPEVGRTGYHGSTSGPNVLLNSNFHPLLFYTSDFWGDFFMFFCIVFYVLSIFSPHSSCHHFSQFIPLSLLYGKTFLMLYSASVKPGAYFLCPKLIANVRRDPSPHPRQHLLPFWH